MSSNIKSIGRTKKIKDNPYDAIPLTHSKFSFGFKAILSGLLCAGMVYLLQEYIFPYFMPFFTESVPLEKFFLILVFGTGISIAIVLLFGFLLNITYMLNYKNVIKKRCYIVNVAFMIMSYISLALTYGLISFFMFAELSSTFNSNTAIIISLVIYFIVSILINIIGIKRKKERIEVRSIGDYFENIETYFSGMLFIIAPILILFIIVLSIIRRVLSFGY